MNIRVLVVSLTGDEIAHQLFANVMDAKTWIDWNEEHGLFGRRSRWVDEHERDTERIDVNEALMSKTDLGETTWLMPANYVIHITSVKR